MIEIKNFPEMIFGQWDLMKKNTILEEVNKSLGKTIRDLLDENEKLEGIVEALKGANEELQRTIEQMVRK